MIAAILLGHRVSAAEIVNQAQQLPEAKDSCKKDGFQDFVVFKNQGGCVGVPGDRRTEQTVGVSSLGEAVAHARSQRERRLVSREGIEPSTRRLRGGPSGNDRIMTGRRSGCKRLFPLAMRDWSWPVVVAS